MTIDPKLLDGRPLSDYERETLTILQEECAEVIRAASKLLRFGACNTNPATGTRNHLELCLELGDLDILLSRTIGLQFFDEHAFLQGKEQKREKLKRFMLHDKGQSS